MAWNGQQWVRGDNGYYSQSHHQQQWGRARHGASWTCRLCNKYNSSKKACAQCRASRDFADTGHTQVATPPTPPSAPTRAATHAINQQLKQALNLLAPAMGASLTPAPSASPPGPTAAGTSTPTGLAPTSSASKSDLQARIKSLESAAAQLPTDPSFVDIHRKIHADIDATKKMITELKPIGARLDACRAALDRSKARRESAEMAVMTAQAAWAAADNESTQLQREVASLEQELQSQPPDGPQSAPPLDSVTQLKDGMAKVLDEMACGIVPPDVISNMHQRLTAVFNDVTAVAQSCRQAERASTPTVYEMLRTAARQPHQAPPPAPQEDAPMHQANTADAAVANPVPSDEAGSWEQGL